MDLLSLQLSDASGVPYYRQIEDQLAQAIRSGLLRPREQLPSVRELAARLLVSLITVRRAYADLEAARLIVRRQGYGTFVADDVAIPSKAQALAEAREKLAEAVDLAGRLGIDRMDVEKIVSELLSRKGVDHGNE